MQGMDFNCVLPNSLLQSGLISQLSGEQLDGVFWVREASSTQDLARAFVRGSSRPVTAVFVADAQSAGRGTHGRSWKTPAASVLMTVVAAPQAGLQDLSGLPVAAGMATARVLRSINPAVCVKWPNDLWLHEGKLAGILCETCRDARGVLHVAAGIGVNIALEARTIEAVSGEGGCRPAALLDAGDARCGGRGLDNLRISVAALAACALIRTIRSFSSASRAQLCSLWVSYDALAGRRVRVLPAEDDPRADPVVGVNCGITRQGELVLMTPQGRRVVASGTLRPE